MRCAGGSILVVCLLALAGCGGDPLPVRPLIGARPAPVSVGKVQVDLPAGHVAGSYGFGLFCLPPYNDVLWITETRMPGVLGQAARDGLMASGLRPTPGTTRVLTGRLADVHLVLCRRTDFWFGKSVGITGEAHVRILWELSDPPAAPRQWQTEGQAEIDTPAIDKRYDIILRQAVLDAAGKLASLPDFRDAATAPPPVAGGNQPMAAQMTAQMTAQTPPAAPVPAASAVPAVALSAAPAIMASEDAEEAVPTPPPGSPLAAGAALVTQGEGTGIIVDAGGLVLLPDTGTTLPDPVPLTLSDGRIVPAAVKARGFGFHLLALPDPPAAIAPARRQRPAVSQWLFRPGREGGPVGMVAAHTGPARSQGMQVPSLLIDLDPALSHDPPWFLVDGEGRLAGLRMGRPLAGEPAAYAAPPGVLSWLRGQAAPPATAGTVTLSP